jgi:hypothetical protein
MPQTKIMKLKHIPKKSSTKTQSPADCNCVNRVVSLIKSGTRLQTLGKRRTIDFWAKGTGLYCKTDGCVNTYEITISDIQATCERYCDLLKAGGKNSRGTPLHLATGQYTKPAWEACPNYRTCPYIAAAIAHVCCNGPCC